MAFCDVAVFAPDDTETPYQEGCSDRNGCFAFVPDTNGIWRVTVDDGMGHRMEARVDASSTLATGIGSRRGADRLPGVVLGVGLLLGVFGAYALLVGRAQRRRHACGARTSHQ
jgi:nickel transport protein